MNDLARQRGSQEIRENCQVPPSCFSLAPLCEFPPWHLSGSPRLSRGDWSVEAGLTPSNDLARYSKTHHNLEPTGCLLRAGHCAGNWNTGM